MKLFLHNKNSLKIAEYLCWAIGLVAIGFFILVKYSAAISLQNAKISIQEDSAQMSQQSLAEWDLSMTDTSTWSQSRKTGYQSDINESTSDKTIGIISVPKLELSAPIYDGTSDQILNIGVGRVPGTSYFGLPGNVAIAGHRDGFFRPLKDIKVGDEIEVQHRVEFANTSILENDKYIVSEIKIVSPQNISVLEDSTHTTLTLITCYPFNFIGSAPQRYIVKATKVTS